jgi:Ankyrin repeats (many copies)
LGTVVVEFDGESSKMPIFDLLLHCFPDAMHLTNAAKEMPLHVASKAVRLDIVMRLIELGVDANATDGDGKTAYEIISAQKQVSLYSEYDQRYLLPRKRYLQEIDRIASILRPLPS